VDAKPAGVFPALHILVERHCRRAETLLHLQQHAVVVQLRGLELELVMVLRVVGGDKMHIHGVGRERRIPF